MKIWRIIKTGLAVYGGYSLVTMLYKENKDKVIKKIKKILLDGSEKLINEIFKNDNEVEDFVFYPEKYRFKTFDEAYEAGFCLMDNIQNYGFTTVNDLNDLSQLSDKYFNLDWDDYKVQSKWVWTDPNIFAEARIDRFKIDDSNEPYRYYLDIRDPIPTKEQCV